MKSTPGTDDLGVLHVTSSIHPNSGGPSRTVVQLTDSLAAHADLRVTLLTQSLPNEPTIPSCNLALDRRVLRCEGAIEFGLGSAMRRELMRICQVDKPKLIHSHGIWHPVNHWAASVAYRHSIPFITHPRGMLEPWAINHKMWKKRLALILYQQRDLRTANVLVATAESEGESLRALGFRQPIAVIPNGVCTNEFLDENEPNLAQIGGQRKVLFLSRIQGKKGLLNLIQAWAEIERQGWILQIAGPNEEGHLEKVLGLADQ